MAPKPVYYSLPEEEMQDLVNQGQAGDGTAQLRLLEVFNNFLAKYVTLLNTGRFAVADYDLRRFIGLFVKDSKIRYCLLGNKLNAGGMHHIQETLRGITYMVNRYGDVEDVEQTVRMAFLHCVSVYKRKGEIPFSAYLYSYFFYVLKKQVDTLLVYQLGRKSYPLRNDIGYEDDDAAPLGFAAPATPGADELLGAELIDELWVAGDTASGPFLSLTIGERQLLKWRYVDGDRSGVIAARLGEHPNSLREQLAKIRQKLQAEVDDSTGDR